LSDVAVLAVDDHPDTRALLHSLFEPAGAEGE
jgi:hypothetical protein